MVNQILMHRSPQLDQGGASGRVDVAMLALSIHFVIEKIPHLINSGLWLSEGDKSR